MIKPNTADLLTVANRARRLINQATDANAGAVAALLQLHGFEQHNTRMCAHPTAGVTVSTTSTGYRIAFYSPSANNSMGVVDLPGNTAYGVVEQVAVALGNYAPSA